MAQVIKLKRTAVQGKIPTTSQIDLGELAINTYDGRIFFEKDDGTTSIQEILTSNSDSTGSFTLGDLSASSFISASSLNISGNASIQGNLTLGGNITIGDNSADVITVTSGFSGSLIPDETTTYDLGSSSKKWNELYVETTYSNLLRLDENGTGLRMTNIGAFDKDTNNNFLIFSNKDLVFSTDGDSNTRLTIDETTGDATFTNAVTASHFVGDGSGLTGLSTDVSQVATVTSSFDNQSSITVTHNFNSKNVIISVYGTDYSQIIPQSVTLTDNDNIDVVLSSANSGHVVVAKGGHIVSGSTSADSISGLSDEIQTLTSYREDVSGASFYTITHNLNESYPFVQAWNTSNNTMELPTDIESTSANELTVSFSTNFIGKIIVKK